MGLDTVELVMKIEKTFGIQIPDPDAELIGTVGEMHDYIWGRVQQKETDRCKSQSLFYRLRLGACSSLNVPKEKFTADASLNELIPFENRREFYKELAGKTGLVFPALELEGKPAYVFGAIGWILVAGGLVTALVLHIFFDWTAWIYLMPVAAIYLTIKLYDLFEPYRTSVAPRWCATLQKKY